MAFKEDRKTLGSILTFTRKVLDELVAKHIKEDKSLFQAAWKNEVKPKLEQLIQVIGAIPNEQVPQWRELQDRGLTGDQLKLKRARLAAAAKGKIFKKILNIINIILGSIPGAEAIKEFKEFAEEGIDDPNASISATFS